VLQLNTALHYDDLLLGNKHWLLDGSCVLVGNDAVLAIRHTVLKSGLKAAFFPYEGFFLLDKDSERDYKYGDAVTLINLDKRLRATRPFPFAYGGKDRVDSATFVGYGQWKAPAPNPGSGSYKDGIQRRATVEVGLPEEPVELGVPEERKDVPEDDNLDLNWWSPWNGGVVAELNNSGGPLLWEECDGVAASLRVVGIGRETKGYQQICSRIANERYRWLCELLPERHRQGSYGISARLPARTVEIPQKGIELTFEVPSSHWDMPSGRWKEVAATLSATDGLRLQMGPLGSEKHKSLADVAEDDHASGRFLYREWPLPKDAKEVTIGVAPVAKSLKGDGDPASVEAQICCGFY
jgi:hypothetical protein